MENQFDVNVFFDNLSFLISEKGMKVGEFEKKAGVNQGYISRKAAKDSTKIKLDFVVKAADILGVSIDRLLKEKISDISEGEEFCLDFMNKLIEDTEEGKLLWEAYHHDPKTDGDAGLCSYAKDHWEYSGLSQNGIPMRPSGVFFCTSISDKAEVHLGCVKPIDSNQVYYEVWLVPKNDKGVHDFGAKEKVGTTSGGKRKRKEIVDKVLEVYSVAADSRKYPRLTSKAREIIESSNVISEYTLTFDTAALPLEYKAYLLGHRVEDGVMKVSNVKGEMKM